MTKDSSVKERVKKVEDMAREILNFCRSKGYEDAYMLSALSLIISIGLSDLPKEKALVILDRINKLSEDIEVIEKL